MPVVEVSCPHCGAKLKATDEHVGKKAKCKKCGEAFRIPGGAPVGDSVGDPQMLSALAMPTPPLPPADDDRPTPAKDLASLPSADAFDFPKPAAPAPAKPAFGATKAAAPPAPAAPAQPAAKAAPAKPAKSPEPDDDEPPPKADKKAKPKPAPDPEPQPAPAGSPFAFGDADPEETETPRRKKRREAADLDEDFEEKPRAKKRRDEDDEDDDRPRKKRDEGDDDKPRNKKRRDDDDEPRGKKTRDDEDDKPRKKTRAAGDESDDDDKPRYRRPEQKAGMGKAMLLTGAAGALALALGIAAVVVYVQQNKPKPTETTKKDEEKKEPDPVPPPVGVPVVPKDDKDKGKVDPKPKDKIDPKPKDPEPKPKEKLPPEPPPRAALNFPATVKTFSFAPPSAKPEPFARPTPVLADLDAPLADVKAVYPPRQKNDDFVAVVRAAGAWGFDVYSRSSGRKADRVPIDGDPRFTDASADRKQALAVVGTKATVWDLEKKTKLLDAADVYADKPEHAKAGLAAAAFLGDESSLVFAPTGKLLLVSTAGAVSVYDVAKKAITDEFVPPGGRPGQLVLGRSLAINGQGIGAVMDLDGVLHDVDAGRGVALARKIDLGGRVLKPLGLAAERGKGRILYAVEVEKDKGGKSERGLMYFPLGATEVKQVKLLRWPDAAGEPTGALLAHTETGGVTTATGVVLFETRRGGEAFNPLGLARADKGLLASGDEDDLWYAVPDGATTAVRGLELPLDAAGLGAPFRQAKPQPLATFRVDKMGLAK